MAEPAGSNIAWDQAWEAQYAICRELGERMEKAAAGRSDAFRAALIAYLIEYLSERLRISLHLPGSDDRPEGETRG